MKVSLGLPPPPKPLRQHIQHLKDTANTTNILTALVFSIRGFTTRWSLQYSSSAVLAAPPPVVYLVTLNGFVAPSDVVTVISRYKSRILTISRIAPRVALFIVQFHNSLVTGPGRSVAAAGRYPVPD